MNEPAALRVLIVDDEPLARALVREYLKRHADLTIVGECEHGLDAVKQIGALDPDLVFLDIQMPKLTGLEVLELTGRRQGVIFTTAYDEHAIRAFELRAIDYLLKPFTQARFDDALSRARELLARAAPAPALDELVTHKDEGERLERLLIRDKDQVHVVPVEAIDCVEAQGDYLAVHTAGKCLLKAQRLSDLEAQLDSKTFLRVHRSWIINLAQLQSIERQGTEGHAARLRSGQRVPISRSGYDRLKTLV